MTKILLLLFAVLWLLRFLPNRQTCPSCGESCRPDKVQTWYLAWLPNSGQWQCPHCGHRWKGDER